MPYLTEHRQLLDEFRLGSKNALEQVYDHYAPGLSEFLRHGFAFEHQGGNGFFRGFAAPFDLQNAMQEVFMQAFREPARLQYDGLRPYANYLYGIARNYVFKEFRRRNRVVELFPEIDGDPADAITHAPADATYDPVVCFDEREIERLLTRFLDSCEVKMRRYWELRYCEGLTQNDVAQTMGLTRIQIRRIEARFKRDLLQYFKGNGYLTTHETKRSWWRRLGEHAS